MPLYKGLLNLLNDTLQGVLMRVKQNEPAGVSYPLLPPLWSQQEAQPRECKECSWNKNNRK